MKKTNDVSFDGRAVIVTGAGEGLGRWYAREIARRGGAVVVNDLGGNVAGAGSSTQAADKVVDEILAAGGKAVASYDNVATAEGASRIASTCIESFGKVDALINNAGNLRAARFEESRVEDLMAQMSVHLVGAFYVTKAVWPHMRRQKYGRIVFTTSSAGMFGNPLQSGYAAAKGAVTGLMNVLSLEGEADGILCNALMPNAHSRMTKAAAAEMDPEALSKAAALMSLIGKSMEPEFNVGLAVYLASEKCTSTHEIYSACAGRIGRVFIGVTTGWKGSPEAAPSAEEVAENFDQVRALNRGFMVPSRPAEEIAAAAVAECG